MRLSQRVALLFLKREAHCARTRAYSGGDSGAVNTAD